MYKRLKSPFSTQIEVTGACPNLCQHCYNFWREKSGESLSKSVNNSLSPKDAEIIIQKLSDAEVFSIVITGGEPLLNMKTCLTLIEMARSKNMEINMNSNITLLTKNKADSLRKAGLKHILTSILGPTPNIHDSITQRLNSFKSLIKGVKTAQDAGIQVSANMVVSQINVGYVKATAEVVANLGIKSFSATKAGCPGNCTDFSNLAVNQDQLTQLLNDLCWVRNHFKIHVDTLEPIPICGLYNVERPEIFTSRRCVAGITTMTVSYDGSVRPCSHIDISSGNLLKEDFSTIWTRMDLWSKGLYIPDECKTCSLLLLCGAGCRMEAKTRTGNIKSLDPYSSLGHIPEMSGYMKKIGSKKSAQPKILTNFRTAKFRIRKEYFGGVVALKDNSRVFLDKNGFKVLSQLLPNTEYALDDLKIDWEGINPSQFISRLYLRKVLLLIKKGGDLL